MYVRLAAAWADPSGAMHGAGEFVDVDVVTLAELEEQGVVENAGEEKEPEFVGPSEEEQSSPDFVGPSFVGPSEEEEESADEDEDE